MKKIFIILSALVLTVAGCNQFIEETPTPRVYVDAPSITVAEVKDSSFNATVTPVSGTGYYSVVVTEGKAKALDSMKVFKLSVSGALYSKTVSAADAATQQVSMTELAPNSDYTIYTVSASTQGSVGKLVSKTVHTSDNVAPFVTGYNIISDTVVVVSFSEVVEFTEVAADVKYYALNKGIYDDSPIGTIENITVKSVGSGSSVAFYVPGLPNGAYYNLAYPAGSFVDLAGNKCVALEHSPFTEGTTGPVNASKASGRKPTVDFDLTIYGGKPVTMMTSMTDAIWLSVPEDYVHYRAYTTTTNGTITYMYTEGGAVKVDIYPTGCTDISSSQQAQLDFGWNGTYNCGLVRPNVQYYSGRPDPIRGAYVTIVVPTYLTDIYGNQNNPLTIGPFLYSYGYTTADVIGTYDVEATGYFSGTAEKFKMVITESDNQVKGNVMITEIFGASVDEGKAIYADFDGDLGSLYIYDWQPFKYNEEYKGYIYLAVNGADYVILSMPSTGTLGSPDNWFGAYLNGESTSGWLECYKSFDAVKSTSSSSAAAVDSAKPLVLHTSERTIR